MPSPFPGMDPYLEDPALWPTIHQRMITYLADELTILLPPHYVVTLGERLYVVQSERDVYPDAVVATTRTRPLSRRATSSEGTIASGAGDPAWVFHIHSAQVREAFVQIRSLRHNRRVVTLVEFLSPTNKAPGSEGRRLYLEKQREILESSVHLIEIDLLRQGEHSVAVPRDLLLTRGRWDYLVCLHRGDRPEEYEVWPVTLRDRLPRIRIPLTDMDPEVVLDLQPVFDRCYDAGGYARWLDYHADPPVPLPLEDAEWATARLRERGLR